MGVDTVSDGRYVPAETPAELDLVGSTPTTADALAAAPTGSPVRRRRRAAPRAAPRGAPRGWLKLVSVASIAVGLVLWQVLAQTGAINETLSSDPVEVAQSARSMFDDGSLGSAVGASAELYGVGLALSITIGIVCGIVIGWWRTLGAVFDPWIAVLYSTPLIASMPLIIAWFGIGFESQVVMVVLVSVFPLLVNVIVGSRQVDDSLLRMARSFGASQAAVLRTLVLPSLIPYIVTGVRIGVGAGLVGVVIGEYFEGSNGIGGMILKAGEQLDSAGVFVGLVILSGTALTLTSLIRALERKVSLWREA
jgi:ABC-type nitrate/sulfonate/bicarbonate transport system permease component